MDLIEDLSARILLKNILSTEPPRTPIARRYFDSSFSGEEIVKIVFQFSTWLVSPKSVERKLWKLIKNTVTKRERVLGVVMPSCHRDT